MFLLDCYPHPEREPSMLPSYKHRSSFALEAGKLFVTHSEVNKHLLAAFAEQKVEALDWKNGNHDEEGREFSQCLHDGIIYRSTQIELEKA